jgi:hypothetical protein
MFSKKEYYQSNDEYYKSDNSYYQSDEEYYRSDDEYYQSFGQDSNASVNSPKAEPENTDKE